MTVKSAKASAYDAEYQKSPEQVKNRVARNKARREAIATHGKAALKGKDVDHKKPLISGGSDKKSNTRIKSETANRGWRKGKSGYTP